MATLGTYSPRDANYTLIYPREVKRRKTDRATNNALSALKDFYKLNLIKENDYKSLKHEISVAKTDDAVSLIMSRLRMKIYG